MWTDAEKSLFDSYLKDIPLLHTWDGTNWNTGGFIDWQLVKIAEFIRSHTKRPRVIETGAGNSTLAFLFCDPKEVVSICPDEALFQRIRDAAFKIGINTMPFKPINGPSELVLPKMLDDTEGFDFALIDGKHGWPAPFVDLCYCNYLVKSGGFIMVDDVQLKSCKEVASLLAMQPGYEIVLDIEKSLVFKKTTTDKFLPDWTLQPYTVKATDEIHNAGGNVFALYS